MYQSFHFLFSFLLIPYVLADLRSDFNARVMGFLNMTALSTDNGSYSDLARLGVGYGIVSGDGLRNSTYQMAARLDCSDFDVPAMIRILWDYGNSSMLSANLSATIKDALLNWQYWIDEYEAAFQGNMMFWTENHQMDFHVSEYLAGHLLYNETFPGTGMTGAEHAAKGRDFVLQWLERRYRWGSSEWKSDDYMQFQVRSVITLASLAPEQDVRTKAAMVLDLFLYDLSIHSFAGGMVSARGRAYASNKFDISTQSISSIIHLLKGGGFVKAGDGATVMLSLSTKLGYYQVPQVVLAIAADQPEVFENRERIGLDTTEASLALESGLGYDEADDGIGWWGEEAYATPETIGLAFVMGDTWDLYDSNETTWKYFSYFVPLWESDPDFVRAACAKVWPFSTSVLGNVSSYIYRTPDATLASVLDYRPGVVGMQQHVWQATLSSQAIVFTTQPGPNVDPDFLDLLHTDQSIWDPLTSLLDLNSSTLSSIVPATFAPQLRDENDVDYSDGYWTGSASMPRTGHYKNLAIMLYQPPFNGEPHVLYPNFTHAYFSPATFDLVQDNLNTTGWIFGSKGNGYIGLYTSSNNISWMQDGDWAGREIVAWDAKNLWICVIGRQAVDKSFQNFTTNLLKSQIMTKKSNESISVVVSFPTGMSVSFGWNDPLVITNPGQPPFNAPLAHSLRFDSPYVSSSFPARDIYIKFNGSSLFLDYDKGIRIVEN